MSTVHPFPVPGILWYDWAIIFAGLGIGVGTMFEIIRFSVDKKNEHRVYTWVNFWLLLSGVIHVSTDYLLHCNGCFGRVMPIYFSFNCATVLDRIQLLLLSQQVADQAHIRYVCSCW